MSNSPIKTTLKACRFLTSDTSVSTQCQLKAESGAIAKVLSVHGTAVVTGKEVLNGEVTFDGELQCRMTYIDGEGVRKVLSGSCEFHDSIKTEVSAGNAILVICDVADIAASKVEVDSVTLKGIVDVHVFVCPETSMEAVTDCGENVYGKTKEVVCYRPAGAGEVAFTVDCEKETDIDGELLTLDADAAVTALTPRVDGVVAEGIVVCNALYKSTDGQLKNTCYTTAFCEEIPLAGVNGDASVRGAVYVKGVETAVTHAEGVPSAIRASVNVVAQAIACMPETVSVVTDAFCPGYDVDCKTESWTTGKMACCRLTKNVEGTAELGEGMPALDTVLGVTAVRVGVAGAYPGEGKTRIEGVLSASVLYYNKEYGTTNSVAVELPYSVMADCEISPNTGTAIVVDVNAKSFRAGKIDLAAEVRFDLAEISSERIQPVTEMTIEESEQEDEVGVTVFRAEPAMELWDIAKGLNVSPESVVNENPTLAFPTAGGEKVVLYRPLTVRS